MTSIEEVFVNESLNIQAFPMRHRIPTFGFIISENEKEWNLVKSAVAKYNFDIQDMLALKLGKDIYYEGKLLKNSEVTIPPTPPKRFAYCSDTVYDENLVNIISDVDLLYHEATFLESLSEKATQTKHSTAKQAATIASKAKVKKLMIGHFSTRYSDLQEFLSEAREVFPNTILAEEGKDFDI
jgi:ribonuclease Z